MKKYYFFLFLIQSMIGYSQNITLDEMLSLRKKDVAAVEEYLTAKNWSFLEAKEPSLWQLGEISFSYKKSSYDDKAVSFITYLYSDNTSRKRISIQINNKEKYTVYMNRLKTLGLKLKDTKIEDGIMKKIYQGATTTIMVMTGTQKDEYSFSTSTNYNFAILDNSDYEQNYGSVPYVNEIVVDSAATVADDVIVSYKDTDGDGIGDDYDKCPTVKGTFFNDGCPEVSKETLTKLNSYEKTIYFNPEKSSFMKSTYSVLQSVAAILKEYPSSNFILEGYTDSTETTDFKTLSTNRAKAVRAYLIDQGIDASRLMIIGNGKSNPAASNKTDKGRELNRRVVIRLTE